MITLFFPNGAVLHGVHQVCHELLASHSLWHRSSIYFPDLPKSLRLLKCKTAGNLVGMDRTEQDAALFAQWRRGEIKSGGGSAAPVRAS
jgi:hypothetical protein